MARSFTAVAAVLLGTLVLAGGTTAAAAEPDLDALVRSAPRCAAARTHCLGIKLHIAVDDGAPVASAAWITGQLAQANHHFAAIDAGFQIVAVAALPGSAARIRDVPQRNALAPRVAGTVIDVFITAHLDDIDLKDSYIYGVTWPKGSKKYVILSTMAWERTLAHELGHVFGLPHSTYAISIMNKTERTEPPLEQRTFHSDELAIMRAHLARLLRARVLATVPAGAWPVPSPASTPAPTAPQPAPAPAPTRATAPATAAPAPAPAT